MRINDIYEPENTKYGYVAVKPDFKSANIGEFIENCWYHKWYLQPIYTAHWCIAKKNLLVMM